MRNWLILLMLSAACGQAQKPGAGNQRPQSLEELLNDAVNRQPAGGQPAPAAGRAPQAGGNYYRMQIARIVDHQGFGEPVEVGRFLIPSDWRQEGGVYWDQSKIHCPSNIIQTRYRATSADGASGFEIQPVYVWQAASDPNMHRIMQQQAAMRQGCDAGPVADALSYLRQVVVPRMRPGARILGAEPLPAVAQAKQAELARTYGPMVQAGYIRGFQVSAAAVRVEYQAGGQPVEEWISTAVQALAMPSANTAALMQGVYNQSAATYSMISDGVFAVRMPAGRFDRKLAALIVGSIRRNPQYEAAVSIFLQNMNNIALRGAMDRARIWREAAQQVSATINESYRNQQAVQDRAAANFSDAIRGVQAYQNPRTGERVELMGGFDNAWVSPRGEYLLSDTPGFNPGITLREDWTRLNPVRD
jgi:hypothetical protein